MNVARSDFESLPIASGINSGAGLEACPSTEKAQFNSRWLGMTLAR
jgi:hypothetical protein